MHLLEALDTVHFAADSAERGGPLVVEGWVQPLGLELRLELGQCLAKDPLNRKAIRKKGKILSVQFQRQEACGSLKASRSTIIKPNGSRNSQVHSTSEKCYSPRDELPLPRSLNVSPFSTLQISFTDHSDILVAGLQFLVADHKELVCLHGLEFLGQLVLHRVAVIGSIVAATGQAKVE